MTAPPQNDVPPHDQPKKHTRTTKADVYRRSRNDRLLDAVIKVLPVGGRILDLGCASGGLLDRVSDRAGYRAGVESDPDAARVAATLADQIVNASITDDLPFPRHSFDVVVCADVLEHLVDPWDSLTQVVAWCRPEGAVVVSVPNIANWQARLRLLRGRWYYEQCGLFDDGHLRFFTLETLSELLRGSGLCVSECRAAKVPPIGLQIPAANRLPSPIRQVAGRVWSFLGNALAGRWPRVFAYQFVSISYLSDGRIPLPVTKGPRD